MPLSCWVPPVWMPSNSPKRCSTLRNASLSQHPTRRTFLIRSRMSKSSPWPICRDNRFRWDGLVCLLGLGHEMTSSWFALTRCIPRTDSLAGNPEGRLSIDRLWRFDRTFNYVDWLLAQHFFHRLLLRPKVLRRLPRSNRFGYLLIRCRFVSCLSLPLYRSGR